MQGVDMSAVCPQDVRDFLDNWQADPLKAKEAFVVYKDFLVGLSGVSLDFKAGRASVIPCAPGMRRSGSASFSCWWTWWTTNRKAAGCPSAFTPT